MKKILAITLIILNLLIVVSSNSFTFAEIKVNKTSVTPYSIPISDVLGDKKIVRTVKTVHRRLTQRDIDRINAGEDWFTNIIAVPFAGLPAPILRSILKIYRNKTVDVVRIGGIYSATYYCRKAVYPKDENANYPAPFQYYYVTIFYNSSRRDNRDIAYILEEKDGPPRLYRPRW